MNWYDWIVISITSFITFILLCLTYKRITMSNIRIFTIKNLLYLLLVSLLTSINIFYNDSFSRAIIGYALTMFLFYIIFSDNINKFFLTGSICYFFVLLSEIILSISLIPTGIIDLETFDQNLLYKSIFSILTSLLPYLVIQYTNIYKFIGKIVKSLDKPIITVVVMLASLLFAFTIAYKFVADFSSRIYVSNIILIVFFALLISLVIYNRFVINREVRKTEELLELITKYEKKNDEYRAYKHELLNNLLALKSIKNKNSKEFDESLDELISQYNTKSSGIKNVYKLPSGLKGIIYYKLNDIEDDKYNINVNISKQVSINLDEVNHKEYMSLCKIVGIVLDNAIEAMKKSDEKKLFIDAYKEKDCSIIEIYNTFDTKATDISKIYNKNYSTKGKNRGLGLYLANLLLKNSKYLRMEQKVMDNFFNTKIYVKDVKEKK